MKLRDKNPVTAALVQKLVAQAVENKAPVWRAVADALNRPRQGGAEVPLSRLESLADSRGTLLVPGTVLGNGDVTKKLTVAALRFSSTARQKIEKAGGSCLSISEVADKHAKGMGVRIIG